MALKTDVRVLFGICLTFLLAVLTEEEDDFTYANAPGVAMDYKVHVDPGKEDCYYQYVYPGSTLYVSFQVLRGGDGMAGFAVRHPNGQIVHPYQWKPTSEYEEKSSVGGYYSVCIDNQFSRFAAKLVNMYITTFRYDEWEKYSKELEELQIGVENFTLTLTNVGERIQGIIQYQHHSRSKESRDYNLLMGNQDYVSYWSLAQCAVIMATCTLQVYFVRRLFEVKNIRGVRA